MATSIYFVFSWSWSRGEFTDKPKLAKAIEISSEFMVPSSVVLPVNCPMGSEPYTFNGLWVPLDDKLGFDLYLVNDFGAFVTLTLSSDQGSFKPLENLV